MLRGIIGVVKNKFWYPNDLNLHFSAHVQHIDRRVGF